MQKNSTAKVVKNSPGQAPRAETLSAANMPLGSHDISFKDLQLNEKLTGNLEKKYGITEPTPVQEELIKRIREAGNTIVSLSSPLS